MNCCSCGATSCGQTKPSLPIVMAAHRDEKEFPLPSIRVKQTHKHKHGCARTCVFEQGFRRVGSVDDLH